MNKIWISFLVLLLALITNRNVLGDYSDIHDPSNNIPDSYNQGFYHNDYINDQNRKLFTPQEIEKLHILQSRELCQPNYNNRFSFSCEKKLKIFLIPQIAIRPTKQVITLMIAFICIYEINQISF